MPQRPIHDRLTPAQQDERVRAASAKAAMRRDGLSLDEAAARHRVRRSAVLRWFRGTIRRDAAGTYRALPDRELFPMTVVAPGGSVSVTTRGSAERELVGRHYAAINALLKDGDADALQVMAGVSVGGAALETDPDEIEALFMVGELDFLEIYDTDGDTGE